MDPPEWAAVLGFWFDEAGPKKWFTRDAGFDALIAARFGALRGQAAGGGLDHWQAAAEGALALVILLDQFPRNMFRGAAAAFADDAKARAVAMHALAGGHDRALPPDRRRFLYLPFMHSEALADQDRSVALFDALRQESGETPSGTDYARGHRDIVRRFGRFPHRNRALGRASTPEEEAFLAQPGSSF